MLEVWNFYDPIEMVKVQNPELSANYQNAISY